MFRVTFSKAVTHGGQLYEPGSEYRMSREEFWHFWSFGVIGLYENTEPKLGPYDRIESGPVFVIGCGPSLRGFPFEVLRERACIVCNRAHEVVPWARYMVTMDYGAFVEGREQHQRLQEFKRVIFTKEKGGVIHPKAVEFPWPTRSSMVSDSIHEGMHARHSGQAAVNVAYCLGYDPIYFLGIDCQVDYAVRVDGQPHYYEEFSEAMRRHILRPVNGYDEARMNKWRGSLDGQARQYAFRGIEVVNLGPGGALEQYRKMDWQEVLQ